MFLFRGTADWGWTHISHKHSKQRLFTYFGTVEELVWTKCSQQGDIHLDSTDPQKLTVTITVAPTAFMALKYIPKAKCYSIITVYSRRKPNPEPVACKYQGPPRGPGRPIYAWLPYISN